MYRSFVMDSPQAQTLKEAAQGKLREADQRHTSAYDATADAATGLVQLASLVHGLYARTSQRHDLTPVQAKLLCILADGPRGMADLAQCFGVEKAALTGLVDRAERRGLVKRMPVHGDRRALHVRLTDAGRRSASVFNREVTEELELLLSPLPPKDREQFRGAIAAIIAGCRPRHGPDPTGT